MKMNSRLRKRKQREIRGKIATLINKCTCFAGQPKKGCENCKQIKLLRLELERTYKNAPESEEDKKIGERKNKYPTKRVKGIVFSKEMVDFLEKHHHEFTYPEMAEKLGLTIKQVQTKCTSLGICCKHLANVYDLYENGEFVTRGRIIEIAKTTNRNADYLGHIANGRVISKKRKMVLVDE